MFLLYLTILSNCSISWSMPQSWKSDTREGAFKGKVVLFTYHLLLTPNESEMKKKLLAAYNRPLMYPFLNPKAHSIETFHHRYVYICLCTRWSIPSKCSTTRQNVPKLKFYICVGRGMGWDCEGRFAFALVFPFYPSP